MQWQKFGHNRKPVTLFRPTDPVKEWLNKQDKKNSSPTMGYRPEMNEEYIEIRLPAAMEESLNKGDLIILNEDYSITPIVDENDVRNN